MAKRNIKVGTVGGTKSRAKPSITIGTATPSVLGTGRSYLNVAKLLGGTQVLKRRIRSKLDVHDIVVTGIDGQAVFCVLKGFTALRQQDVAPALGMSARTVHRLKPNKPLTREQSGRTWKFAEVLDQATGVFGTREQAEQWLKTPAIALNRKTPIELMSTVAGTELVEQLLGRLEYGVYT